MVRWTALGLPVLASAVLVFVASSISNALFHDADHRKLPGEGELMDLLRRLGAPSGNYLFPRAENRKQVGSPEFKERWRQGPAGFLTLLPPGDFPFLKTLLLWFLYCVVVGLFTAGVAAQALPAGASAGGVFLLAALVAFGGHALALWPGAIWFGRGWTTTLRSTADGLVYGLLTGAAFGWLWPG